VKLSEGVEWALHCAVNLAFVPSDRTLPAGRLAELNGVPTAYLAKHLQVLARSGVLEAVPGPRGGYRLARPATEISMLDVVEAVDGAEPAFRCTEIRRRGPAAVPPREYRVACSIHAAMDRADAAWRAELRSVSIADLVGQLLHHSPPRALEKGAAWFQEVLG
jgi:Rrf2 family protein